MKNIHINELDCQNQNIYITSDEEIKDGYYVDLTHKIIMKSVFYTSSDKNCKKIILTTDVDLIKDGVQEIDNEFLEWFVKNPSCEEVTVTNLYGDFNPIKYEYKIIIPKEEPKQEKLEEAAKEFANNSAVTNYEEGINVGKYQGFIAGAKWILKQLKK